MKPEYGFSAVSSLRLYYLDYPAVVLGFAALLTGVTWSKLGALTLLVLGSMLWQVVTGTVYNLHVYRQLYQDYLLKFPGCSFDRRPLTDFVPQSFIDHLLQERVGIKLTGLPLGFICIVKRRVPGTDWPRSMSSFPLETLPWYIMVLDERTSLAPFSASSCYTNLGTFHSFIVFR